MGSLLTYSGLTTKVKAMESHLITDDGFRQMASYETVPEAVEFLKRQPAYADIFSNIEDSALHRANIEQLLTLSQYRDFAKLYRFSNLSQRKFLDLYFMHYEIAILKKCLRSVLDHRKLQLDLSMFQDFFKKHSKLDLVKLSTSADLTEFAANLDGSPYGQIFSHFKDVENPSLFDYEMQLDLMYFKTIWKVKDKYVSKAEQNILTQCFGSKLDMLNIQWIYRSKKYYHLEPTAIYTLLIPNSYKLKKDQIRKLAEAGTVDEFFTLLQGTYYGGLGMIDLNEQPDLEQLYDKVLDRIYSITSQKDPYSIAILNSFLYFKEIELQRIITVIEAIRYGIESNEIMNYILKN